MGNERLSDKGCRCFGIPSQKNFVLLSDAVILSRRRRCWRLTITFTCHDGNLDWFEQVGVLRLSRKDSWYAALPRLEHPPLILAKFPDIRPFTIVRTVGYPPPQL